MASEQSPAFSFYVRDWLADAKVRAMTNDARGVYIDLLAYCWQEGALPTDLAAIARIARLTPGAFRRIWSQLEPCFRKTPDGFRQKRLDRERTIQQRRRDAAAENGRKGAEARWQGHTSANDEATADHGVASASASASAIEDQEQRADARDPDPPNPRVLARLAYDLPDSLADEADKADELKRLAVRYRLTFDGASIGAALDQVARTRKPPLWVRDPYYGRRPAIRRRRRAR
jgi:uncharacterized protein YdaU (DUF1376 family)